MRKTSKEPKLDITREQMRHLAEARQWPIGTGVTVTRDNGDILRTVTRSEPFQLGSGTWVISVEGISGVYLLDRVTVERTLHDLARELHDWSHGRRRMGHHDEADRCARWSTEVDKYAKGFDVLQNAAKTYVASSDALSRARHAVDRAPDLASIESERQMNARLTEENEMLEQRVHRIIGELADALRLPGSPSLADCHKAIGGLRAVNAELTAEVTRLEGYEDQLRQALALPPGASSDECLAAIATLRSPAVLLSYEALLGNLRMALYLPPTATPFDCLGAVRELWASRGDAVVLQKVLQKDLDKIRGLSVDIREVIDGRTL